MGDGSGIRAGMATEIEGLGPLEEAGLIGFDPAEGRIHMFSMNRLVVRDHVGGWVDEHTLAVRYAGDHDGITVTVDMTLDFSTPDRVVARVVDRENGVPTVATDLTLVRRDGSRGAPRPAG